MSAPPVDEALSEVAREGYASAGGTQLVAGGVVSPPTGGGAVEDAIMEFFAFEHLPEHLRAVSRPFGELARWIAATLPRNAERTVALRKTLEAKDAAVRAALSKR